MVQVSALARKNAPTKEEIAAITNQLVNGNVSLNEALMMLERYDTTMMVGRYLNLRHFCDSMEDDGRNPRDALIELLEGFQSAGLFASIETAFCAEKIAAEKLEGQAILFKKEGRIEEAFEALLQAMELRKEELTALKRTFANCHKT